MALIDGIVSYYKFDGDATDSAGSNDGTVTGATNGSSYGKINEGYNFDGSNDYINSNYNPTSRAAFSISFWAKTSSTTDFTLLLFNYKVSGGVRGHALYHRGSYIQSSLYISGNNAGDINQVLSTTGWNDGDWHHYVITYDGTTQNIYIDGSDEKASTTYTQTGALPQGISYYIGCRNKGTPDRFLPGDIDEVGFWNRAISSSEVTELYNSGAGNQYPFSATPTNNALLFGSNF